MANKEKVLEVKEKVEKVSEQHLKELQSVVNAINSLQFNIGKIETQKHKMLHEMSLHQDQIIVHQKKLIKEYGTYDVNLEDGTINWPEEKKEEGDEK